MDENIISDHNPQPINGYNTRQNIKDNKDEHESFTISSEEAALILGVNRSRLSQLTQKGIFAFERRKIDTRNRLFYRLNDLLSHQRSQVGLQQLIPQTHFSQNNTLPPKELQNNNNESPKTLKTPLFQSIDNTHLKTLKNSLSLIPNRRALQSAQEIHCNARRNQENALYQSELQIIKDIIWNHDAKLKNLIHEKLKTDNNLDHKIQQNLHSITQCKNALNQLKMDVALIFQSIQELSQTLLKEKRIKKFHTKIKPKYLKKQPK